MNIVLCINVAQLLIFTETGLCILLNPVIIFLSLNIDLIYEYVKCEPNLPVGYIGWLYLGYKADMFSLVLVLPCLNAVSDILQHVFNTVRF